MHIAFINGEVVEAVIAPADRVAFERRYNLAFDEVDVPREEWTLFLAFSSLERQGLTAPGIVFEQWIQLVDQVDSP